MIFRRAAAILAMGAVLGGGAAVAATKKKPVPKDPQKERKTLPKAPEEPVDRGGDLVIEDFEHGTPNWIAVGPAFAVEPVVGEEVLKRLKIGNAVGRGVASSEFEGDESQGNLTSPEFRIARRYLSFLIGGGNFQHSTCLDLIVNGQVVKSASGENSDQMVPVIWDLQPWAGQKARIRLVDAASGQWGHVIVDQIFQTDTPGKLLVFPPLYEEKLRPQFHFTARQWTVDKLEPGQREEGWCNDLNGLIYYDGEYHLFAQRWAKCWIHAVSKDLVHWKELEPAFWEEKLGSGVQSGTCVIDYKNTSGLGTAANPPMVAFWSRFDNKSQCLSYSLDHGRTWKLYEKNPLFEAPERDPKVFWHDPTKRWVMMMYGNQAYHVFTSSNLLDWKNENSSVPNSFECPDFFELPVDGAKENRKWVLVRGDGKYSLGSFDGVKFTEETKQASCDVGPNFYATQSFENTKSGDGRRIQVAWMRGGKYPGMPFNQQVSFPCELSLRTTASGVKLFRKPVKEISSLFGESFEGRDLTLRDGELTDLIPPDRMKPGNADRGLLHLEARVKIPAGTRLRLNLRGTEIMLTGRELLAGDRREAVAGEVEKLEILLDRTSVEVFVNDGELSYTACILPESDELTTRAQGGDVTFPQMTVHALKSAWKKD